jgi:type II secretory pathway pseudopilin PulG
MPCDAWRPRVADAPSVAPARRAATGTPAGWSRRAARRALQTGERHRGVHSVELRPGGAVRYIYAWRQGQASSGHKQVKQVETACKRGTAQQHRVFDTEKQVGPTVGPAEAAGNSGDMDVDQAWSSKQLGRSRARLASYGKAMGFLKGLVFKRWIEAVKQQKQQRQQQQQAEAAAAAQAAADAAEKAAREQELIALRRELKVARSAAPATAREREANVRRPRWQDDRQPSASRSPSRDDEQARRPRPPWSSAAATERQPPEAARETAVATGQGTGKGGASGAGKGYGYGYGPRGRGQT